MDDKSRLTQCIPLIIKSCLYFYLSSNSAKRLSKCRNASFMRSVYKLRSRRAWSLVMLRTSSKLRVRSLARGLIAMLSISLFMIMEPAAKHWTGTSRDNIIMHRELNCLRWHTWHSKNSVCEKKKNLISFCFEPEKGHFFPD